MKEFDYTKWDNKPREMWVWNDEKKEKKFVVYVKAEEDHALTVSKIGVICWYKHCAEIEPARRMTNYELAHWLWEGAQVGEFRELIYVGDEVFVYTIINYNADDTNKPVSENIKIRVNGGEWKEPLIEK